jgi:hypothetical protein
MTASQLGPLGGSELGPGPTGPACQQPRRGHANSAGAVKAAPEPTSAAAGTAWADQAWAIRQVFPNVCYATACGRQGQAWPPALTLDGDLADGAAGVLRIQQRLGLVPGPIAVPVELHGGQPVDSLADTWVFELARGRYATYVRCVISSVSA